MRLCISFYAKVIYSSQGAVEMFGFLKKKKTEIKITIAQSVIFYFLGAPPAFAIDIL